uniref:Ion-translocating oxidoreductase complex subunit D n=1 Tax=candidate division WOR-3 bacterium TaxID=2052148 RepID=A0A7C4XJN1_UNCW3
MNKVKKLLIVSSSPHIHSQKSVEKAMNLVKIALLPQLIYSFLTFGIRALIVVLLSVLSAIFFEFIIQYILSKEITITDGSAGLTGLLLAFTLPPGVPFWIPILGSAFSIIVVKQLFGGIGCNIFNPALAGRAFLTIFFPAIMSTAWIKPVLGTLSGIDTITSATPLTVLKNPEVYGNPEVILNLLGNRKTIFTLFLGNVGGSIGETSSLLILIGGIFLLLNSLTDYRIVIGYTGSFLILVFLFERRINPLFHLFSGGLLLGIFFMATDWVTSPVTKMGRWIFGAGCGILTIVFRLWTKHPEGVCFAILLMNLITPLIDQVTKPRIYGTKRSFGWEKISLNYLWEVPMLKRSIFHKIFVVLFTASIIYHLAIPHLVIAQKKGEVRNLKGVIDATQFPPVVPETLWLALDSLNNLKGIVFKSYPNGYGGAIPITAGVDTQGRITGISIGGEEEGFNETEGLGSRVREPSFTKQFIGKSAMEINLKKDGGEIDAITGATISSSAVCKGIRESMKSYAIYLTYAEAMKFIVFPGAMKFFSIIKDTLWYAVSNYDTLGIVFYGKVIDGNDTVKFIAGFDKNEKITGLKIIFPQEETDIKKRIMDKVKNYTKIYKRYLE